MSTDDIEENIQKRTGRFNKTLAKKTEQQLVEFDGPADSQGIELASPGKKHFFQIRPGEIHKVWTTKLFDPDGEEIEYVIQADNEDLRIRIFDKVDDVSYKALVPCCNWFGTEFLWCPNIKPKGGSKIGSSTAKKAIQLGQQGWIKCKWISNSIGWRTIKYPTTTEKQPEFSNIDYDQMIDQVFDGKYIESLDHEAIIRHTNPSYQGDK